MTNEQQTKWHWIPTPEEGGAGGDAIAKLFRGNAFSAEEFLARESIQNSWDAARTMRSRNPGETIPFRMVFRFAEYEGEAKSEILKELGLSELADHFSRGDFEPELMEKIESSFAVLDEDQSLRVLYMEDYGTHGLYGNHKSIKSHLRKALYVFGVTSKADGSGGSFGFGKSSFIRASKSRTLVAYSHFAPIKAGNEFKEDDPTTRRLVGWSWWETHVIGNNEFEGRAAFFSPNSENKPIPFVDDVADEIAKKLGITPRTSGGLEDIGTTLALVDPVVDPQKLLESIELWWWPALIEHGLNFEVEVILPTGEVLIPRPRQNETLRPFIRAFGLANGTDVVSEEGNESIASVNWQKIEADGEKHSPGVLALTCGEVSEQTLKNADGELVIPKIALIRSPRMVIKYLTSPGRNLPITGVYIADDSLNSYLRATEPPAHDDWDTKPNSDISESATSVAVSVINKIRNSLSKYAQEFAPAPLKNPKPLSHFSKLLGDLLGGNPGPWPPPPPQSSPVNIQYPNGVQLAVASQGTIWANTKLKISLSPTHNSDSLECKFSCSFKIFEDDKPSKESVPIRIDAGTGAIADLLVNGKTFTLTKDAPIELEISTDPYSDDWTGQFDPIVTFESDQDETTSGSTE